MLLQSGDYKDIIKEFASAPPRFSGLTINNQLSAPSTNTNTNTNTNTISINIHDIKNSFADIITQLKTKGLLKTEDDIQEAKEIQDLLDSHSKDKEENIKSDNGLINKFRRFITKALPVIDANKKLFVDLPKIIENLSKFAEFIGHSDIATQLEGLLHQIGI